MKILSKKDVRSLVLYSSQHIDRLENPKSNYYDPAWPKRVHIGSARVGWIEAEVLEWLQQRIDQRQAHSSS